MLKISHRGNLNGTQIADENNPVYIQRALDKGYDVEIDVWASNGNIFLGHDGAAYPITIAFLENDRLWCHAKNLNSLELMLSNKNIHCFWHESDKVTLTSRGYIWTYVGGRLLSNSICVLPEINNTHIPNNIYGICSDYIVNY